MRPSAVLDSRVQRSAAEPGYLSLRPMPGPEASLRRKATPGNRWITALAPKISEPRLKKCRGNCLDSRYVCKEQRDAVSIERCSDIDVREDVMQSVSSEQRAQRYWNLTHRCSIDCSPPRGSSSALGTQWQHRVA